MLQLFMLLLAAAPPVGPTAGERMVFRDRTGPTPVTGLFMLPPKVPDCKTDAQIQKALEEKANGIIPQSCDPPKSAYQPHR